MDNSQHGAIVIKSPAEKEAEERDAAHAAEQRRDRRTRNLQLWFNGILMCATIVTVAIVLYQNHILVDTLDEMKKQSVAAQASVGAAQEAAVAAKISASAADKQAEYGAIQANAARAQIALSEDSLRARLAITEYRLAPLVVGEHPTVFIEVENVGQSAAVDRANASFSMYLPALLPSDLASKATSSAAVARIKTEPWFLLIATRPKTSTLQLAQLPFLPPNATFKYREVVDPTVLEHGGKSTHICRYGKPLTAELLRDIQANTRRLFFFGYSRYSSFGKRHITRFCGFTFPPDSDAVKISGQPLMACGGKWNASE